LTVDATDVQLIGKSADGQFPSGLSASAEPNSTGDAGDLTIKTNTLLVKDGTQVSAGTFGSGKGGNLRVDATDVQIIGRSGLSASAQRNSTGDAGDSTIKTNTLLVKDGAQVSAATFGSGKGGNLRVDATDVQIIGTTADGQFASGLFTASAEPNSTGNAGDLTIETNTLLVQDGARVSVESLGTGTAGNMTLNARSIRLNNNALLTANTQSALVDPNSEQATININSQNLIMRRSSNIRTNATGDNVIGGNININSDIIAALENSDLSANSANFRGGNVQINAQGIFGTQFRDVASDRTSDITATGASPEFSGSVELNIPEIDPNSGLVNLPTVPVDTEVAQACTPDGSQANSEFVVTGRGGLPPNPTEALSSDAIQTDWVTLNPEIEDKSSPDVSTKPTAPEPDPIVEAQGWIIGKNGAVVLTASVPTATPHSSWQTPSECHVPKT
jgi:large exoprotein involved in heme utilization and adhesion